MSSELLDFLLEVAREAAAVIDDVYKTPFSVEYKGPKDPVTAADRQANELICSRLSERYPGVPIVAEESNPESFEGFQSAQQVFFVDPLDGTREFVEQNGEFVVMIGFLDGDRATHGVIHAPVSGTAWAGAVGHGAWEVDQSGNRAKLNVSEVERLAETRIVASRSHRTAELEKALKFLGAREVITLGSAGLKGAAVARGLVEAYISPSFSGKRWDACAADALVVAAGGTFTDEYGEPIDYRAASLSNDRGLVASNSRVHEPIMERLADLRKQRKS